MNIMNYVSQHIMHVSIIGYFGLINIIVFLIDSLVMLLAYNK